MKAGATYNSGKCPYSTSDGHAEIVGFGHYDGMKFNICATHWPFYKDSKNSSGKYLYRCELYPPLIDSAPEPSIEREREVTI